MADPSETSPLVAPAPVAVGVLNGFISMIRSVGMLAGLVVLLTGLLPFVMLFVDKDSKVS
jgi:hypothetical protein